MTYCPVGLLFILYAEIILLLNIVKHLNHNWQFRVNG